MVSGTYDGSKNEIIINLGSTRIEYPLLPKLHCERCGFPGETEKNCRWHSEDVMDKTLALGIYYPLKNPKYNSSNLSKDIYVFKRNMSVGTRLGILLAEGINNVYPDLKTFNALVPIPRVDSELKTDASTNENYNPQDILASEASRITGIPSIRALIKLKPYTQHGKNRAGRKLVLDEAEQYFKVAMRELHRGDNIILVDDVRTSGYTASACAKVLKAANMGKVYLLVLGRDVGHEL